MSNSSKKEEERNEKIIRGLMKLPPNRRCVNCNNLGPQYVCTNFWSFICTSCSGIHREFTHRVKSVSMAKFTEQEVEALQKGGNQRARELFLKDWDAQRMRLPDSSNPDKLREFIKNVYVDKRYAGARPSDKPPRDTQSCKGREEDHRRASSYHSFSQSPPYDHQYEERRYGKQAGMLTRKPGSDRGRYEGKMSSFLYSPGRLGEQMYEERFANDSPGTRISDYSVSNGSDPFRSGSQSQSLHDPGYSSPPEGRDILVEDKRPQAFSTSESNGKSDLDKIPCLHRNASSGSFGSFDSNSTSLRSANSGCLIDNVLEPELASGIQQAAKPTITSLSQMSSSVHASNEDLFGPPFVQSPITFSTPSVDLFADVNHQPSLEAPSEQTQPVIPLSANEGWATFDLPQQMGSPFEVNKGPPSVIPSVEEANKPKVDAFSSTDNNLEWFSVPNFGSQGHSSVVADQWHVGSTDVKESADVIKSQSWNAFDDSTGCVPQTKFGILPENGELQVLLNMPPTLDDLFIGSRAPEVPFHDEFLGSTVDDKVPALDMPLTSIAGSFLPQAPPKGGTILERTSTNPFDLPYDSEAGATNVFLDMSTIEAALPESELPATFLGGLPQPWFSQNPVTSFIPSVPQGGLSFIGGQLSSAQLQNIPSQGSVASLGGNPFA